MKKNIVSVMMASVLAASVLAGCGSGSSSSVSADTTAAAENTADAEDTAEEADEADAAESDFDAEQDITVVSREDGSGTRGAFIELTGVESKNDAGEKVDNTTVEAQIVNSTSVVLTTVAEDEAAIGYISLGSLNDTVTAVKVNGAEATEANILDGSYTLARPFNIATLGESDNEVVTDFINYILGADGQAIVSDNGYIPSEAADYESTQPSGTITVGGSSSVSPLMEKLIEAYAAVNPNATIELLTSDSTTGMTSTIDGGYDIGMASRELKEEELSAGLVNTVIATDGIAVIVNNANPNTDLTTDEIKSIYTGEVYTWAELQ